MSQWILRGLRTGIKSTRYPEHAERAMGVSPGFPVATRRTEQEARALVALCPTRALAHAGEELAVDYRRCVHCYRCARADAPMSWADDFERSAVKPGGKALDGAFERSIHILVVDAGDCGACLNEVRQLNNPYYNMHRLGFFITPTPRQADVLLVVGPVTEQMRVALEKAYAGMPGPKCVMAVGACALSGGVFGPSFTAGSGVADVIPVDVEVPGNPPPPLAILHGLLVATGRK
ncbi:MAG: hypothetical protein A3F84_23665 [Candidatus Handelsmanbacteria bacterium RIFCSPLOWO2_12_FULL_64_10]|uniref:NADH:ubiquinone oxidoreductase-like 20kDa subunit domain-containing protein n=1 Tax=Handelsmanbacteria sp. (strain RIFCSPLOWO2_12_FULL_64_10) TaxID=1817868 RepID=A0A1F6CJJ8_HANXR|nr:MAG: hypothetical protein A3F84_23665 [Candidatus Handelsmanbacteria bacterium RIFCSPLOWO2_12_FULL_64_10]